MRVLSGKRRKGSGDSFPSVSCSESHQAHAGNYIPFYCVYSYLSSTRLPRQLMARRCVSSIRTSMRRHVQHGLSEPARIPGWFMCRFQLPMWPRGGLHARRSVPACSRESDCFMVGAGVGALEVCVDAARRYSAPAIDSGHILNMMNDLESKSKGPRLFTFRDEQYLSFVPRSFRAWRNRRRLEKEEMHYRNEFRKRGLSIPSEAEIRARIAKRFPGNFLKQKVRCTYSPFTMTTTGKARRLSRHWRLLGGEISGLARPRSCRRQTTGGCRLDGSDDEGLLRTVQIWLRSAHST